MDELIRRVAEDPESEWRRPEVRTPEFHRAFSLYCLDVIASAPAEAEAKARTAIRIAQAPCEAVRGWGLYAASLRAQGKLDAALAAIEHALLLAGNCLPCLADLDRREAYVKRDMKLFPEALDLANSSIHRNTLLSGKPDHDIHGAGLAKAYLCRGQIHYEAGKAGLPDAPVLLATAVADISHSLSMISRADSPQLYGPVVFNLAYALSATGKTEDLVLANEHIKVARQQFKGVREGSPERAKLDWVTAMVRYELREMKLHRVLEYLYRAQQDFLDKGMVQEVVAVTSDIGRLTFPDQNRIRTLFEEVEQRAEKLSPELRQRLRDVIRATKLEGWNAAELVRSAIEALRRACGPRTMPCLIAWPAIE